MGDNRYVVPDGMLKAVSNALAEYWRTKHIAVLEGSSVDVALAAAVQWLSEHPIVPTREEAEGIFERVFSDPPYIYGPPGDGMPGQTVNISRVQLTGRHFSQEQKVFAEWQSKMFLPREPEVPEFVECDSCRAKSGSPTLCRGCLHNREVIESFGRIVKLSKRSAAGK